ncbi:hypothetical protein V8F44DRAFT_598487 [Aspergillus fumigatus]
MYPAMTCGRFQLHGKSRQRCRTKCCIEIGLVSFPLSLCHLSSHLGGSPSFTFQFHFSVFLFFLAIFTLQDSVNRKISKLGLLCTYDSFHQYGAYLGGRLDL